MTNRMHHTRNVNIASVPAIQYEGALEKFGDFYGALGWADGPNGGAEIRGLSCERNLQGNAREAGLPDGKPTNVPHPDSRGSCGGTELRWPLRYRTLGLRVFLRKHRDY